MNRNDGKGWPMAMASRWRRRRVCMLTGAPDMPAALCDVSAAGAVLETSARPPLGSTVELRHPEAGSIHGEVSGISGHGLTLRFARDAAATAFALTAIGADMSVG